MKNAAKKDMITEQDFNRIIIRRNSAKPENDSQDDSGLNRALETELGEHFLDENFETLDGIEDDNGLSEDTDADGVKVDKDISSENHSGSSTWPDKSEISRD